MKIHKLGLVLLILVFSISPVQAKTSQEELTIVSPDSFAYIWPTQYQTVDWHSYFVNIYYRTVLVSRQSTYAIDSCAPRLNYSKPSFIPLPLLGTFSARNSEESSSISGDHFTCTITYQYQVGLGAVDHIENPF